MREKASPTLNVRGCICTLCVSVGFFCFLTHLRIQLYFFRRSPMSERRKRNNAQVAAIFGIPEERLFAESPETKWRKAIYDQYPGVPDPYPPVWHQNDTELPQDEEWQDMLRNTAEALRRAADVCDRLSAQTGCTQRNELIVNKNTLLCGVHKAEDLVDRLTYKYPLGTPRNYQIAKSNPEIASRIPEILINAEDHVLIWTPRLPSKKRGVDSMVFKELQEMLWDTIFARFHKWHCDFIHMHKPDALTGVYDVDNYAYKPVIDALARALHTNDNLDRFSFSAYNYASKTIKNGTYIHIYNRDEKVQFFSNFEGMISTLNRG